MNKIILITIFCYFSLYGVPGRNAEKTGAITASQTIIERALAVVLSPADTLVNEEAREISKAAFQKVTLADYEKAIEIILIGLHKYPFNFRLQSDFAALLGDCSEYFTGLLKDTMEKKSKDIFNKLSYETEGQSSLTIYRFKNEYYFRFAQYDKQYDNGREMINHYEQTKELSLYGDMGYYYQGVGAAHYAKQLLIAGDKIQALDYAQKALVSWAQYFTYENDYYNSYVHYGLALGILGHKQEMLRALNQSACLINRSLDYHEFKEVIDFFIIS